MNWLSCFLIALKYGTPYIIVGDMNARRLRGNLNEPTRSDGNTIEAVIDGDFSHKSYNMKPARNSLDATFSERGRDS